MCGPKHMGHPVECSFKKILTIGILKDLIANFVIGKYCLVDLNSCPSKSVGKHSFVNAAEFT